MILKNPIIDYILKLKYSHKNKLFRYIYEIFLTLLVHLTPSTLRILIVDLVITKTKSEVIHTPLPCNERFLDCFATLAMTALYLATILNVHNIPAIKKRINLADVFLCLQIPFFKVLLSYLLYNKIHLKILTK